MARKPISFICFSALWLFIALVSAYDTARCVQDAHILIDVELNPLARFILRRGGASLFVGCKFLGTSLVLGVLCWMWERKWKHIHIVASVIALAQLGVLVTYCPFLWR